MKLKHDYESLKLQIEGLELRERGLRLELDMANSDCARFRMALATLSKLRDSPNLRENLIEVLELLGENNNDND